MSKVFKFKLNLRDEKPKEPIPNKVESPFPRVSSFTKKDLTRFEEQYSVVEIPDLYSFATFYQYDDYRND